MQADAAYKNPEGYAQDTYKSVTGSSTAPGTGGSSGSTYESAKDTVGSYTDKAGKEVLALVVYLKPTACPDQGFASLLSAET